MHPAPSPPTPSTRPGFALVLSLVVMSLIVLVVLSLAGLLRVESGLAAHRQSEVLARLNALAALRLAQGAIQERFGPDTRVSAPASLYDSPAASSATTPGSDPFEYPILGAWRSWEGHDHDRRPGSRYAGRPQAPNYLSKLRPYAESTPAAGRFLGWMVSSAWGYGPQPAPAPWTSVASPPPPPAAFAANPAGSVPLLGAAVSAAPTQQVHLVPTSIADGRPASGGAEATDGSLGTFAWWVGGENQKVRLSLPVVLPPTTGTPLQWAERTRSFGLPDFGVLGFPDTLAGLPAAAFPEPPTRAGIQLLPASSEPARLSPALSGASPPLARAGFHDLSLHA